MITSGWVEAGIAGTMIVGLAAWRIASNNSEPDLAMVPAAQVEELAATVYRLEEQALGLKAATDALLDGADETDKVIQQLVIEVHR